MPIYEYLCDRCGRFEVMQKVSDAPVKKCPTCKARVSKLISNTSFQLKGSGWYATDYARKGTVSDESGKPPANAPDGKETKADSNAKESTPKAKEASAA
jgi:putative FmdB family regulatory protein